MLQEKLTEKEVGETRLSKRMLQKWLPTWFPPWISSWLPTWLQTWLPTTPRVTKRKPLEEAQYKLVSMQNIAVNKNEILEEKKKVLELRKKESLEAQNIVHAIELEIEAIKVKGQFEETFLRFPHIAEQIFESLEIQSVSKCQEVSKCWKEFIFQSKPFFQQLENYTSIPRSMLKKSLKNYNFQTLHKMANCASISYEKADQATIPFKKPSLLEPKGPTLFYYILSGGKLNRTQFLLAKLMILNKMSTSNTCNQNSFLILSKEFNVDNIFSLDDRKAVNYRVALLILIMNMQRPKFGEAYTSFNDKVKEKRGEWGSLWSWITILHVAVAQNHLAICKLIFEQIQDIHLLHSWGKVVLQRALLFGHKDMCEFLIDKIPGLDPLEEKNWWVQNLIQMAEDLHFLSKFFQETSVREAMSLFIQPLSE